MMNKYRNTVFAILAFLTGWTGLLGGSGVAVLCIHAGDAIHFLNDGDEIECCDEKKEHYTRGIPAISALIECNHCLDLEIKGTDEDPFFRAGAKDVPAPTVTLYQRSFTDLVSSAFKTNKQILPSLRAPPPISTINELGIKKTVLRL